jgi:hypothetical protein
MQKKLSFILCLFFLISSIVQAQSWEDVKKYGGSNSESVTDFTRDKNGNFYIIGQYTSSISIGNINLTTPSSAYYVAKLDSNGNAIWANSVTSVSFFTSIYDLEVDTLGNVYLTGAFTSSQTVTFGNNVSVSTNTNPGSFYQTFIVKYNVNGLAQWARAMSSSQNVFNYDRKMVVTKAGDIYIAGSFAGIFEYNNANILSTSSTDKTFLIKIDGATGGILWSRNVLNASAPYVFGSEVALSQDESTIYPIGFMSTGNCFNCAYSGLQDTRVYIARYDSLGVFQGSLEGNPQPGNIFNLEAAISNSGDVYITGNFDNALDFGINLFTNFSFFDAFFVKSAGGTQWSFAKLLSSVNSLVVSDIICKNDDIILGGSIEQYTFIDTSYLVQAAQNASIVALQFDKTGEFEYFKTIRSVSTSQFFSGRSINGLANGEGDKYYAAGDFNFDGIFGNDTLFTQGSVDLFIAELSCTPQQVAQILGDTIVCQGTQTYSLPPTQLGPGIDYQWTLSGGGTFTQGDTFINVIWNTVGIHTISVTAFNGCGMSETTTLNVNVIDIPSAQVINGDPTACLGQSAYNVPANPFNTYNWTISGGGSVFPISNTAIINWAITGNANVNVQASNECGTGVLSTFPVIIKAIPSEPTPITGNNNICISTQTYAVNAIPNVNYNWSLSSGGTITSNGNIATVNWSSAGNHTIIVTPTNECGTGSSRTLAVNVNDVPTQPSTVVGNLNTCIGTESYSVVGNTTTNYTWALSSGGVLTSGGASANIIWTTPGTHTLVITPSNICGTGTPRTVNVTIRDLPTQVGNFIGLDTVCIGTQNYQVPVQIGINYNWTISGGGTVIPNGNSATVNWSVPGTHTITVTPYNSCGTGQSRSFVVFVKNINAAFNNISGEDTVCLGIENYSVANIGGITYNWSLNGGGTLTQLNNTAFVTWSGTGVYTLDLTTSDGCNSALNVEVRNAPTQPTAIAGDAVVCIGTYNYGITAEPNTNYSWSLSGGGILIENVNLATINWTTAGIYTLTVTPFNDCGQGTPQSITVDVRSIPIAPTAIVGDTLVCAGSELYNVTNNPSVNYNWSLSNSGAILNTNNNQATINWQSVDTNTITVTASNLCGTSPQTTLAVEVLNLPNTPTISGDTSTCFGNETYTISTENYTTYSWNLSSGGALTANQNTATVNWSNAGNHTLNITATNQCGTAIPSTLGVAVIDVPVQPLAIVGDATVCQSLQSYSVPSATNTNYIWTISGGGAISGLGNVANINWTIPGTHTITVTPFNNCGIGVAVTKTITVTGVPSQPSSITGQAATCLATLNYSVTNDPTITYTWTLNGGGTLTQNGNIATVNWQTAGVYNLTVIPQTICGTGSPRTITVQVSDVPALPQLSAGNTSVCLGTELYSVTQASGINYVWSVSGGGTINGTGNNATVNWTSTGTQTITITPSNGCGNGAALIIPVDISSLPTPISAISGSANVCLSTQTYTIPSVPDENYTWTLSSGGVLSASGNQATINWLSAGNHTISVVPSNGCGVAPLTSLVVNVGDVPTQPQPISGEISVCEGTTETYSVPSINNINYTWSVNGGASIVSNGNAVTVDWATSGNYILTVTPSNICGTGAARTINVGVRSNNLSASAVTGDQLVCTGSEVFYTADFDNDLNYDWFISGNGSLTQVSNSAVVQWQDAGNATIGLIPSSDCGVGDTAFIDVTIQSPLPIPTITSSGDSLIASSAEGLKWYVNETLIPITERFLIPQLEGIYTITTENVCGATGFSQPFIIGGATDGLFLYPNPARNIVTLRFPVYLRWYYYDIIDYSGKVIQATSFYNGQQEEVIDVRRLDSGIYLVRIYTELGYFNKKLIIQN